jgi:hypothetical protein
MVPLIVIFGVIGIGMVLVIYGTIVKNQWGINLDPVSCPRCKTPLPQIRKPQTLQQALWGGGTCSACGANVDKWGREIGSHGPPSPPKSSKESPPPRSLTRKLIVFTVAGFFGLTLLFDLLGMGPSKGGLPPTLGGWIVVVGDAAVETAIFTALFCYALKYAHRWFSTVPGGDARRPGIKRTEQERRDFS